MNKEFKKTFFVCLMSVLLVISNLVGLKLTNFMDITIGVDFVTFPWTFLCTLMIFNLGGKKEAYRSILIASIIQLLITISYVLVVSLGSQTLMPDASMYVNMVFQVNQMNILGSVLAFILSHCLLIYIYENFKHFNKELYGIVIGLLGAMFLNSIVYLVISLRDYETIFIINMLLSNVIIDIIMIVIMTIMFYILKDNETDNVVTINKNKPEIKDLNVEEVITKEKKNISVKKNNNVKKTVNKTQKKVVNKNPKKVVNKTQQKPVAKKINNKKPTSTSKVKVKKTNK